jgi:hypothetical protein
MSEREEFLQRLDQVEARLAVLASADPPQDARTDPDPGTGERWEVGQVWAHLAEFVPYWVEQVRIVIANGTEEPAPFGRTKTDAGRIAAIERDRNVAIAVLWSQTLSDIEMLRTFMEHLDTEAWRARGLHPKLGVMDMRRIFEEFMVGHLEQHADQLSALMADSS